MKYSFDFVNVEDRNVLFIEVNFHITFDCCCFQIFDIVLRFYMNRINVIETTEKHFLRGNLCIYCNIISLSNGTCYKCVILSEFKFFIQFSFSISKIFIKQFTLLWISTTKSYSFKYVLALLFTFNFLYFWHSYVILIKFNKDSGTQYPIL